MTLCLPSVGRAQVAGFRDIPPGHWAAGSVAHLAAVGIILGNSDTPLSPAGTGAKKPGRAKKGAYDGNKPVTRYELAATLYRFVQYIERANRQPKSKFGAELGSVDGPTAVKLLLAGNYLPASSPLAKGDGTPVTADQFADALAQVIAKTRENLTPRAPDSAALPGEKPVGPGL